MSRRRFLGDAGTLMSLPFLPSLAPRRARAAAPTAAPVRFLAYFCPCGMNMGTWTPSQAGADYALSPTLAPLMPVKSEVLVASNLRHYALEMPDHGDHARGTTGFLSGTNIDFPALGNDIGRATASVDQLIAGALKGTTRIPSLQLGTEQGSNCDFHNCAYSFSISWADPQTPLMPQLSPKALFDRLFAGFDPAASGEAIKMRAARQKSILDGVLDQLGDLDRKLSQADRVKLAQYTGAVRQIEAEITSARANSCAVPQKPSDDGDVTARVSQLQDLMVLAFQCDLTRVISFELGASASARAYPFLGLSDQHHNGYSHHGGDPGKLAGLTKINTWEIQQFASLLQKMKAVDEGGTSLLDNSVVFLSSELSDGNAHNHAPMPVLLAGRGHGIIKPGRHLSFDAKNAPDYTSLLLTFLRAFGVNMPKYGTRNVTNTLSELAT